MKFRSINESIEFNKDVEKELKDLVGLYAEEQNIFDYGDDIMISTELRGDLPNPEKAHEEMRDILTKAGFIVDKGMCKENTLMKAWQSFIKVEGKKANEASYGGAFDIEDDQFFTRDDLNDMIDVVEDHLRETFNTDDIVTVDSWASDKQVSITVEVDGAQYESTKTIDMRRIRRPSDLKDRYGLMFAADLIQQVKGDIVDESLMITDDSWIRDLEKYLRENDLWLEEMYINIDTLEGEITWGDWKHDHLRCDILLKTWIAQNTPYQVVRSWSEETETDGTDAYSARHFYELDMKKKLDEDVDKHIIAGKRSDYSMFYYNEEQGWVEDIKKATQFNSTQEARTVWFDIPERDRFVRVFVMTRPSSELISEDLEDEFSVLMKCSEYKCKVTRYAKEEYGIDVIADYAKEVWDILKEAFDPSTIRYWKWTEDDYITVFFTEGKIGTFDIVHGRLFSMEDRVDEGVSSTGTFMYPEGSPILDYDGNEIGKTKEVKHTTAVSQNQAANNFRKQLADELNRDVRSIKVVLDKVIAVKPSESNKPVAKVADSDEKGPIQLKFDI